MHPKPIHWLLEGLKKQNMILERIKYREVLGRWGNEDFSKIVDERNFIWSKNEGTIGRATDRLTKEQEREYLVKEYDKQSYFQ